MSFAELRSNVVAAQAPAPTAPWARTLENQVGADVHGGRSNARQWQQLLVRCQKGGSLIDESMNRSDRDMHCSGDSVT